MQRASYRPTVPGAASPGGADMVVTLSNHSTHSTRSGSIDTTDLSAVPNMTTMSSSYDDHLVSFDYEMSNSTYGAIYHASSSFNPASYGQTSQASFGRREYERRETPSTLGWTKDSVVVEELYNFVVIKGKEPYLELQAHNSVTAETPERVYLDSPR